MTQNLPVRRGRARRKSPFLSEGETFATVAAPEIPLLARLAAIRPSAVAIYLALRRRSGATGFCWPSQRELAEDAGVSRAEVRRGSQLLHELGLVIAAVGRGKRANRYLVRRLDHGPLRDLSGPQVRTMNKRENERNQANRGEIKASAHGPHIQKKRKSRKRRGPDEGTRDLPFDYTPVVLSPAPPQEKEPVPSGPALPDRSPEPSGPRSAEPVGAPEKVAVPSGPPPGGAGEQELRRAASLALGRAGVALYLFHHMLKTPARCRAVLDAALRAQGLPAANRAGAIVSAVTRTLSAAEAVPVKLLIRKGVKTRAGHQEAEDRVRKPRQAETDREKPDDPRPVREMRGNRARDAAPLPGGRESAGKRSERVPRALLPSVRDGVDPPVRLPDVRKRDDVDPQPAVNPIPARVKPFSWGVAIGTPRRPAHVVPCRVCGRKKIWVPDDRPDLAVCPTCVKKGLQKEAGSP